MARAAWRHDPAGDEPILSLFEREGARGPMAGWIPQRRWFLILFAMLMLYPASLLIAQFDEGPIQDITGNYHFLSADDTLAILDEEGMLKGYIDVYQGEDESSAVLSYNIIQGTRKKDHVEFRTAEIHRKYYRFSGKVERGSGHQDGDPDYLRLIGDLEIVTIKGDSGQESVDRRRVIFKSLGKSEEDQEQN
jgi:hypothetical protein